ncbi:Octamer-binding transcription factor [Parasponia andersonii]|uniref:Octamer-binding transcription factor n=1 Tax=Parasponia andersonii TaxID=3476 RepID=A0A2P5C984_PARAD|nr:Octamer-binding transcription factor [Parasponia andersonii]
MEVIAGDRQIPNTDEFPQLIPPFPEPTDDLIYAHPTAVIHPPDVIKHHRPISPPHKLRPIRYHARSPVADFPDHGTLGKGFLGHHAGEVDGELESAVKLEAVEAPKISNDVCTVSEMMNCPIGFGSGMFLEGWELNGEEHVVLENESGSSSDDGVDCSAANLKGPMNRKRRKSTTNLEHFLENLVMKVMEKQEQMHNQLIEMIEKMEKERIMREEAWKQLEIERTKRDELVRAQETSRSLAFITFLENMLGEEIQIPEPVVREPCMEGNGVEIDTQADTKCDPNSKRWPEAEVRALIALRNAVEHKFQLACSKGSTWEEISVSMHSLGYNRTAKKCREKWDNINKYFKKSRESANKRSTYGKTCLYFQNLDLLYKNGLANTGIGGTFVSNSVTNNGVEARSEKDSESLYSV